MVATTMGSRKRPGQTSSLGTLRRATAASLAFLLALVLGSSCVTTPALASGHFRFGTVSWAPNSQTNGVDFTLQLAYKKNYVWGSGSESWKESASVAQYKSLSSASVEEQNACNNWDKTGARPDACTALTLSPEVGFVIKFPVVALPSEGQCVSPLEIRPTATGCMPWSEVYGFFMGDGNSREIDLTVTDSTRDVYSPLQNYIVGKSVFSHTYASADNAGEAWMAYFTGGDRDSSLMNNAGGRFRLETQVKISGTNRSPVAAVMPIIPIPKSGSSIQFQIMGYDLNDLAKTPTIRDGGEREYGGVFNYKGATSLTNDNSPAGPSGVTLATSTGLLTFTTTSRTPGFYNQVVMLENSQGKTPVDFTLYVYEPISFCNADCVKSTGLSTFADPDGVYDKCTICGNGVTSDYSLCTPVFQSEGCPGTGDQLTGVKPSEDACKANTAPAFISPTPGIDETGAASPAYPERPVITAYSGSDIVFEVAAEDPDSCSELEIVLLNAPDNTALLNKSNFTGQTGRPSTKATFVWPAPSIEASLDNRPAASVVCFYAFDKYAASVAPYMHCIDIKIQAGPTVSEQVLTRFGCHMGLLWSPPLLEGATKGRFCFFDKSTDYTNGLTFNKYCSAAVYETAMWHNVYVSIEECNLDACPGKLYVDGTEVKQFSTSWGAQDCTKPLDILQANDTYSQVQDTKDTSVCPAGDCNVCSSSLRMGAGCLNKYNTFAHFDGLIDEFVLYNTTVSQKQVSQQLFHLPGHLPIDNYIVGAQTEDIHKGVVAWYRFNDACANPLETKVTAPSSRRRLAESSFSSQLMSYKKYAMKDEWHNKYHAAVYAAGDLASPFQYIGSPWQTPTLTVASITTIADSSQVSIEAIGVAKSPFLSCIILNNANSHIKPRDMAGQDLMPAETFTNEFSYYSMSYQASSATAQLVGDQTKGFVSCDIPAAPLGRYFIGVSNNMGLSSGTVFGFVEDQALQISNGYLDVAVEISGEYTISAWVNLKTLSSEKRYIFALVDGDKIDTSVYIEGGTIKGTKDNFPMPDSQKSYVAGWHHVILTTIRESSTKTGAKIIVDGEVASDLTGGASGGSSKAFTKILVGGVPTNLGTAPGTPLVVDEIMYTNTSTDALIANSPTLLDTIRFSMPVDYSFNSNKYLFVRDYIQLNSDELKSSNSATAVTFIGGTKTYKTYNPPWQSARVVFISPANGPVTGGTTITVTAQNIPDGHGALGSLVCVFYEEKTESNATYTSSVRSDGKAPTMTVPFENPSSNSIVVDATKVSSTSVTCVTPAQSKPGKMNVAVVSKISSANPAYSSFFVPQSKPFTFELGVIKCDGASSILKNDLGELSSQLGYTMEAWIRSEVQAGNNSQTVASVERQGVTLSSIIFVDGGFAYRDSGILTAKSDSIVKPLTWNHVIVTVDPDGQGSLSVNGTVASTFTTSSRPAPDSQLIVCGSEASPQPSLAWKGSIKGLNLDNVAVSPGPSVDYIEEEPKIPPPITTEDICSSTDTLLRNLSSNLLFSSKTGKYESSSNGDAVDRHGVFGLASQLPLSFPKTFSEMSSGGGGNATLVMWAKFEHEYSTGYEMFAFTSSGKVYRGPAAASGDQELFATLSEIFYSGFGKMAGAVDDIYLFSKELELCEIQALFNGNMYSLRLDGTDSSLVANVPSEIFTKPFTISMLVWPEDEGKNYELLSSDAISISTNLGHWRVILKESKKCICEPCSDVREFVSSVPAVSGRWSIFEVSYDGTQMSLYLNGNEMDFMNFGTEDFPLAGKSEVSLLSNFKGYINSLKIQSGTKKALETYLCPLKMDPSQTLHYFSFDFPFLGTEILDLAAKNVSITHSGASTAASTPVVTVSPDPTLTTVEGNFTATSGEEECIRIEAYTSCGRHFLGPMSDFDVTFTGGIQIQKEVDYQNGVYEVCYLSYLCGAFKYNILHKGSQVKSGDVTIAAGQIDPSRTLIEVPNKCANVKQDLVITARDSFNCVVPRTDSILSQFDVTFVGPSDPTVTLTHAPDITQGSYRASYIPEAEGNYEITVKFGGALAGTSRCSYHCVGHSLQVDGYGGVEFSEKNSMYSPLDLADTSFTMMAWVRRGPYGTKPVVNTTVPEDDGLIEARRSLQQTVTSESPSASNHYIFFKGDDTQIGSDIKGYFMAFSYDWTQLTAGVYVPNEKSINQVGEYRLVSTTAGLTSFAIPQDLSSDDGWVHVAAVYTGEAFELYVGGSLRTTSTFREKRFGRPNADFRPLLLGLNFAGEIDEAFITQKALSREDILGMMYCPSNTNSLGVEVAAYIPFNEGSSSTSTTLYRGLGSSTTGSFDAPGHPGRSTFGRSRPGSKVGLNPSSTLSYLGSYTVDATAGEEMSTEIYLKDECGFSYLADTTGNLEALINTFSYNNFRSSVPSFSQDRKTALAVPMGGVSFSHHKSVAGASCASAHFHKASSQLSAGGTYTVEYKLQDSDSVTFGKVDVHVFATNFSTSTSDISGASSVELGKPSFLLATLRDSYGNIVDRTVHEVALNSAVSSEGFHSSPGEYLGDGVYKIAFTTTSPAPNGGYILKATVSGTELDGSFVLNTISPQPIELLSHGGPEALYGSDTVVTKDFVYLFGGAKSNGQYNEDMWKLSFGGNGNGSGSGTQHNFYHKYISIQLDDPASDISHVSSVEVNTLALPEISPDCSGIVFVSQAGELLSHYMSPLPGCKSEKTKFYVLGATKTTYMHYDSDAPSSSAEPSSIFGGTLMDFESFADESFQGDGSLYTTVTYSHDIGDALGSSPSKFTVQVAFYDALTSGTHVLNITSANGDSIAIGTDASYSASYVVKSSVTAVTSERTWNNIRARGWHTLTVVSNGKSVYAFVDGAVRTLDTTLEGFVPSHVSLGASTATSPCLWDQLIVTGRTLITSSVKSSATAPYTNAAYIAGMAWTYTGLTSSARVPATAPHALYGQSLVTYNDKLFVFGGERSGYTSGSLYVYSEASNAWRYIEPRSADQQPEARSSYSACKHGNLLYMFGGKGSDGQVLSDFWIFNMDTEQWTEETSKAYVADAGLYATGQLGGSYGHSCSVLNGSLVLFGGYMKVTQKASNAVAILDLKTYQWRSGKVGPPARFSHASVEHSGSMYVFGGVNEKYAEFSDVWEYSLGKNRWRQLSYKTAIPVYNGQGGIFEHSAVQVRGKMLAFGGQGYGQSYEAIMALPLYNM